MLSAFVATVLAFEFFVLFLFAYTGIPPVIAGGVAETVTLWNGLTEEERQENMRTMKNNGYYRGPASIYMAFGSWANNHPSPADPPTGNADYANYNRYILT